MKNLWLASPHMCNAQCLDFVREVARLEDVKDQSVLEVGALDVNGSPRTVLQALAPASYVGVDLVEGPGVDLVCAAESLIDEFGSKAFDVVVTTEMIEHVGDWRLVVSNLKHVLAPNGLLLLTTRSLGFPYHEYPNDYWRFQPSDMRIIFSDFEIDRIDEDDAESPGVFVAARRPEAFEEVNLEGLALYSMICERRAATVEQAKEWGELRTEIRDLRAALDAAIAQVQGLETSLDESRVNSGQFEKELKALRNTRTFRYTAGVRTIHTRLRSMHIRKANP